MKKFNQIRIILIILWISTLTVLAQNNYKLVILHTNDTHSQVEPTAKSGLKTANMGGYARRMGEISKIRAEESNVLLLDAGDFSQGTPYFNFFNGRIEIDAMNKMKYDAGTVGNHEFDNGIDTLAVILKGANFPIISSNYNVSNTPLAPILRPYTILQKGKLKIGIMALDINPASLIIEDNYKNLVYLDPIETALTTSEYLKKRKKCDVIICLSHLGADTTHQTINDFEIARKTKYIDVIIGGHTHSIITNTSEKNAIGKQVVIAQMGKSGFYLGRIDFEFVLK